MTMDTKMLYVNKFLDFRLSLPQTSLIIKAKQQDISNLKGNKIKFVPANIQRKPQSTITNLL